MHNTIPKIGHPLLDAEHESLMEYAAACSFSCSNIKSSQDCDGCNDGPPEQCSSKLHDLLDRLLPSIQKHFEDEEEVMRQANLEEKDPRHMAIHISAHQHLLSEFRIASTQLLSDLAGGSVASQFRRLHELIVERLIDHLYRQDEKLIPYLTAPE